MTTKNDKISIMPGIWLKLTLNSCPESNNPSM